MELSEILNSLSSGTEKVASAEEATSSQDTLAGAIDRALGAVGEHTEKVASDAGAPEADLMKIASDLANAENDALIKEAHIYGAAVADGFVARLNAIVPAEPAVKQASATPDDAMLKHAMDMGYRNTMAALQQVGNTKVASAQPEYTEEQIKLAEEHAQYVKVSNFNKGREDAVKVATFLKGKQDAIKVATEINKIAASYEEMGFQTGNNILASLAG